MLKIDLAAVAGGRANRLVVRMANEREQPLRLLYWDTPLDPVAPNFLTVTTLDGDPIAFRGPRAKRIFNPEDSLEVLDSGEVRTIDVDLTDCYALPHSGPYRVAVRERAFVAAAPDTAVALEELSSVEIRSQELVVALVHLEQPSRDYRPEGELSAIDLAAAAQAAPTCPPQIICVPPAYRDAGYECRGLQYITYPKLQYMDEAKAAVVRRLSTELFARLKGFSANSSPAFARWFGAYSETARQAVQGVLLGMRQQTSCKNYTISYISFPPKPDIVAVFMRHNSSSASPWDSMGVYPLFFRRPDFGMDSKIGTLAHELSHGYGDTQDHCYGIADCQSLARTSPALAIQNADSYQFYLEELLLRAP